MSLKPRKLQNSEFLEVERHALQMLILYMKLGELENKHNDILTMIPIVATSMDMNRKLIMNEARKIIEPYSLKRCVEIPLELDQISKDLISVLLKPNFNYFTAKNLWSKSWRLVLTSYLYGIYKCSNIGLVIMQEMHVTIFGSMSEEVIMFENEIRKLSPNFQCVAPTMQPIAFGPQQGFSPVFNKEEKKEKESEEIDLSKLDEYIETGIQNLKKSINDSYGIKWDGIKSKSPSMIEDIIEENEVENEMELDMEGQWPETYFSF